MFWPLATPGSPRGNSDRLTKRLTNLGELSQVKPEQRVAKWGGTVQDFAQNGTRVSQIKEETAL